MQARQLEVINENTTRGDSEFAGRGRAAAKSVGLRMRCTLIEVVLRGRRELFDDVLTVRELSSVKTGGVGRNAGAIVGDSCGWRWVMRDRKVSKGMRRAFIKHEVGRVVDPSNTLILNETQRGDDTRSGNCCNKCAAKLVECVCMYC